MLRDPFAQYPGLPETTTTVEATEPLLESRLNFRRRTTMPGGPTSAYTSWYRGVTAPNRSERHHDQRERSERPRSQPAQAPEPQPWTWDGWGRRSERHMTGLVRSIEMLVGGMAGALIGAAAASIPVATSQAAFFATYYQLTLPLGAAVGMLGALVLVWKRWTLERDE
ncbi:MAG: hypothetical protein EXR47_06335 [Dehalococcoidia bacterium]|nr:hypothetical protein [Dehalococcoidia bacterium]